MGLVWSAGHKNKNKKVMTNLLVAYSFIKQIPSTFDEAQSNKRGLKH